MTDTRMTTAVFLRERAAECRAAARNATSIGIARELRALAEDYERDARRIALGATTLADQDSLRPRRTAKG